MGYRRGPSSLKIRRVRPFVEIYIKNRTKPIIHVYIGYFFNY